MQLLIHTMAVKKNN